MGSEGGGPHERATRLSCPSLVSPATPCPHESEVQLVFTPTTLSVSQQREQDPDQASMLGLDPKYDFLRKLPQTQRQQKEGGDFLWQIRSPARWAPTPLGFSWKVGCLRRGQFRGSFAARAPLPGRLHLGWVGVSTQSHATAARCLGPSFH